MFIRLLALLTLVAMVAIGVPAEALTGREVIDTAQQKNGLSTWQDRTLDTSIESFSNGTLQRTRQATVSEQTNPRGEHRTLMEFTGPADVTGSLFLHLSPRGDKDQQWLWTPVTRKARRLADAGRDENFFGTDLSYRDLELLVRIQQWTDEESTATLLPEETIDGKRCHVVELLPKNKEFPYSKYRLWFDATDYLLWQVDIYEDADVFKRASPRHYERSGKYATAREAKMETLKYNTHTLFKIENVRYDSGVSDDLFSVASIQKGR
jgi:outer membrane lipoprotein-sorting protein